MSYEIERDEAGIPVRMWFTPGKLDGEGYVQARRQIEHEIFRRKHPPCSEKPWPSEVACG